MELKHYVIPYIVGDGNWWGGIDFYNHSEYETAVTVKIQRHGNGIIAKEITQEIKPWEHWILTSYDYSKNLPDEDVGRATLLIACSSDVMMTPFQGFGEGGFGLLTPEETTDLKK